MEFIFTYASEIGPVVRRFDSGHVLLAYTSGWTQDGNVGAVEVVVDPKKQTYVLKAAV